MKEKKKIKIKKFIKLMKKKKKKKMKMKKKMLNPFQIILKIKKINSILIIIFNIVKEKK
jgi:hypothetical protein